MSALGGILNFNGAPVDESARFKLESGLTHQGPDGGTCFKTNSIAMIYRAYHTTHESEFEKQPQVSEHGHVLCWNGRLDNRTELMSLLGDQLRGATTDAAIVMAAYLKWKLNCLWRIIGDFAFSLWDPHSRSLILARDIIGSRDLFFTRNEERLIWATDMDLLLDVSGVRIRVDEHYIAGYLTRCPQPDQTPFKDIEAVPPAHAVIVTSTDTRSVQFWRLDPKRTIRYGSDAEYEDHFRCLLHEAVKNHLRTNRPVWSDLSGGLDSSSIVCMADRLIKTGEAEARLLETVSCVRDESPASNEMKFILYVERSVGKTGHHLAESQFPVLNLAQFTPSVIPNALDIFGAYHDQVNKLMAESGARVRLCGNGGDEILGSTPRPSLELSDLLIRGKFLRLNQSLVRWARDRQKPYLNLLWHDALLPILPRKLQLALGHRLALQLPQWLDSDFVKRANMRELMLGPEDTFGFPTPSGRSQSISFLCAVREQAAGYLRAVQTAEIRFPFLYRPLIEFMQAIPLDQRMRCGETRSLQRRALRDLLPGEIIRRTGKGIPNEAIMRALVREYATVQSLLCDSYVARYGYVDQRALTASVERIRYGDKQCLNLLRIIPLEFWLRSLDGRRSKARMTAAALGLPEARLAAAGQKRLCVSSPSAKSSISPVAAPMRSQ